MKSTVLKHVTHFEAADMLKTGAILVDIREANETARESINVAKTWPLSKMPENKPDLKDDQAVIFFCRSGNRTIMNDAKLKSLLPNKTFILEGGIEAWRDGKMPTTINKKAPIELQRQVFIAAGSLMMLGTAIALGGNVAGLALTGFVGAGLTFAGVTGFCGMARILMLMPWNKPAKSTASA